jgi:Domain of unknown function (DUF6542)
MPAQPGAIGPRWVPDTPTRPVVTQPGSRRDGTARGAGGPRDARGQPYPPRSRGPGRWGTWQGGLGVCIVVASAAIGAIATIVTRSAPGHPLGILVVAGTVAAALAVRPRAGWMILPVPALAYLVAALLSGVVFDRAADSSRTQLALAAAQWVANGFVAMALATVLAVAITTIRWFIWHRRHLDRPSARDRGRTAQARPAQAGRRSRTAWEDPAESGYPAGYPGQPGTGPQPGSGPYNFSSGA